MCSSLLFFLLPLGSSNSSQILPTLPFRFRLLHTPPNSSQLFLSASDSSQLLPTLPFPSQPLPIPLKNPAGSSFLHSKNKEVLVRLMLDKVIAPEQFPQVVREQVSPYCCRHKMNLDQTLVCYVKVRGRGRRVVPS